MKKAAIFATILFITLVVLSNFVACKREQISIGNVNPDLLDTTQTGGNNGNGNNGNNGNNGGTVVQQPCSPDSVYFEQQLLPIFRSNCALSGCHDAASHQKDVILDSYTNVRNTGEIRLDDPTNSEIYEVITETDPDKRMPPPPRTALTADQKALVLKWIQQGAQDLHCAAECDTTNVRFSTVIQPLIATRCQGCHSGTAPSGGFRLTNYAEIKAKVNDQRLLGAINHAPGFKPMPYPAGSPKMPQCQLDQVRIWIQGGALNN